MHMQTDSQQHQSCNPKQVSGQYSSGNSPELSLPPQDRAHAGTDLIVLILLAPYMLHIVGATYF